MLAVLAIGGMGGVADVSVNLHTRAPSCRAAVGGVWRIAMQHLIRRIMLNYCANPLKSMTYRLPELPQSHA